MFSCTSSAITSRGWLTSTTHPLFRMRERRSGSNPGSLTRRRCSIQPRLSGRILYPRARRFPHRGAKKSLKSTRAKFKNFAPRFASGDFLRGRWKHSFAKNCNTNSQCSIKKSTTAALGLSKVQFMNRRVITDLRSTALCLRGRIISAPCVGGRLRGLWDCIREASLEDLGFNPIMTNPMPAIFFGHGNPLNALLRNAYTEGWTAIGKTIPRPKAVLCVSAHWYVPVTAVTAMSKPRTIHDFGGFPRELYEVEYPAPGSPELAQRVQDLLKPVEVELDEEHWGLDHGTWSVLSHVFPNADIPVVQLSIDETQPPEFRYEIGQRLAPLRDEGVLVIGSGNIVHNLHTYAWGRHEVEPFDWAVRFEKQARELLLTGNHKPLVDYEALG